MEVLGKALHLTNMLDPIKFAVATKSVADFTVITQRNINSVVFAWIIII
jgi:hypothetical protein